jgi:hypothetical protein
MASAEIDLKSLRVAVNAVLDHIIEDLSLDAIPIDVAEDQYWKCSHSELNDMSKMPSGWDVGSLRDDMDFVKLIGRGQSADVSYNLVHVAPLLRYIAEKVKK